jgi:hypothetical protein
MRVPKKPTLHDTLYLDSAILMEKWRLRVMGE